MSFCTKRKPSRGEQITVPLFRDIEDRAVASAPEGKETVPGFGLYLLILVPAASRLRGNGKARNCRQSAASGLNLLEVVRSTGQGPR